MTNPIPMTTNKLIRRASAANARVPAYKKQQEGMVIIVALFIVALVAALSYIMVARLDRDIYRTRMIVSKTQGDFYAEASVYWAVDQLHNNWVQRKDKHLVDANNPITSPENVVNGYRIASVIYDMQARFNLNNLSIPDRQGDFAHLLQTVQPNLSVEQALKIMRAIVDWISPGDSNGKNEYNDYYLKQPIPYRPAKRLMQSVSELKLVKGMTPKLYSALKPYVCALPEITAINVQTAELPVLATLNTTMTMETAKTLADMRKHKPIVSVEDFMSLDVIKNHPMDNDKDKDKLTVVSKYFLVETTVSQENQHVMLYTLLERNTQDNDAKVRIIWQSK